MCSINRSNISKVKRWLKEQEDSMIDLTKEQVFANPIRAWVWSRDVNECDYRWLIGIRQFGDGLHYCCLNNINGNKELTNEDIAYTPRRLYSNCSLTNPTIPTKKFKPWLTVEDVPVELWGKVLYKYKDSPTSHSWILVPYTVVSDKNILYRDLVYLPLGQPLTGEWLPFESEVTE